MGIPLHQAARIGSYVVRQHLTGRKRYPLVLMLEPLFRCNLACAGCGKIDYPDEILNQRLSYDECMEAIDECGAPVLSIAGGEPLLHREMPEIVKGALSRKKMVILCTNALLLAKKIDDYKPHPSFTWSIHLDGNKAMHDKSVCQAGTYDKAVEAIRLAKAKGFRVSINCTLFGDADPAQAAAFFDDMNAEGLDGITVSPGYAYERAPDQQHFHNQGAVPRHPLARQRRQEVAVQPVDQLPELPGRQRHLRMHAVGQPDAHRVRLAEALLPAGRGLREDLSRADGRHQLGQLRRRQVREVRRLHGA